MFVGRYDIREVDDNIIKKKQWVANNKTYTTLKYDKSKLTNDNLDACGIYRSVITSNNQINVFSPPKSIDYNTFKQKYPECECLAEEYIEGTMINLFYDEDVNKWEIASKSTVGCNFTYFKEQPTFRELFFDICEELAIDFDIFSKECCYSFVMQHPKNKFVAPIDSKKLYLISIFKIDNENKQIIEMPRNTYSSNILLPNWSLFQSFDELYLYYTSLNLDASIMGIIVKHQSGVRTKIRNPNYEYVKHLKGNHCKLQYQYLTLRKLNRVKEYLMYFPDKRFEFTNYRLQVHRYTQELYTNYINCFIKKEKHLKDYTNQFKLHMFKLHEIYLAIKDDKRYINKQVVMNYVNDLEPAQLMYAINYHAREMAKPVNMESMQ